MQKPTPASLIAGRVGIFGRSGLGKERTATACVVAESTAPIVSCKLEPKWFRCLFESVCASEVGEKKEKRRRPQLCAEGPKAKVCERFKHEAWAAL